MPDYDPALEALFADVLATLDPQEGDAGLSYPDTLRRVQASLMVTLQEGEEVPDPDTEQVLRLALGQLDPKNEDRWLGYGEALRRLLSCVDKELFTWTSGLVQPPGPSGDAQVYVFESEPV